MTKKNVEAVKAAKEDLASDDNEMIKAASEKLSNEAQSVFAKIYQQAAGQQQGANPENGTDGDTEFHQN